MSMRTNLHLHSRFSDRLRRPRAGVGARHDGQVRGGVRGVRVEVFREGPRPGLYSARRPPLVIVFVLPIVIESDHDDEIGNEYDHDLDRVSWICIVLVLDASHRRSPGTTKETR